MSMKKLQIFVPSRGRAQTLVTPYSLTEQLRSQTTVVVRKDEVAEYREYHPDLNFMVLSDKAARGNMAGARQFILENATSKYHMQVDDDITSINVKPNCKRYGGLRRARPSEIEDCFSLLCKWIDQGIPQVSFTDRMTSAFPSKKTYADSGRMAQVLCYDRDVLIDNELRFDTIENHCFEDLDMNLRLLLAGYPCRISRKYSHNHRSEQQPGGCQIYRDDDLKRRVGGIMMKRFPGLIELKERENGYVYIRISWKKVLKQGGLL